MLLPEHLKNRLDAEQREALLGICGSSCCLHFMQACAGTGKTQVGKCLIHLFAQMNKEKQVAEDEKRDVAIWLVRTKVLREEILQDLLDGVLETTDLLVRSSIGRQWPWLSVG